jgi:hypothetical protein
MPNPNFPAELGNIPYQSIIGGPLIAAVKANTDASEAAAQFIKDVGFTEGENGEKSPRMVEFSYEKEVIDEESGDSTLKSHTITIPFLLLTNVPYFEVEQVTVDFNVKLNSLQTYEVSDEFNLEVENKGKQGWFTGRTEWSVNSSYQRKSSRSQEVERTYDQQVHVQAGSVEAPEGVKKLLGVLEQTIVEVPEGSATNGGNGGNGAGS